MAGVGEWEVLRAEWVLVAEGDGGGRVSVRVNKVLGVLFREQREPGFDNRG